MRAAFAAATVAGAFNYNDEAQWSASAAIVRSRATCSVYGQWAPVRRLGVRNRSAIVYFTHLQKTGGTELCGLTQGYGERMRASRAANCADVRNGWLPMHDARQWRFTTSMAQHEHAIDSTGYKFVANEVQMPLAPLPCPNHMVYVLTARPPIERLVSHYMQFKAANEHWPPTLGGFVRWLRMEKDLFHTNNYMTRVISGRGRALDQWLVGRSDAGQAALRYARFRVTNYYEYVLCMYHLRDELHDMAHEMGMRELPPPSRHYDERRVQSRHNSRAQSLFDELMRDTAAAQRVIDMNSLDLELYSSAIVSAHRRWRRRHNDTRDCVAPQTGFFNHLLRWHGVT